MMSNSTDDGWFLWAYEGVDPSYPGNGGDDCVNFISLPQKLFESAMFISLGAVELLYSLPRVSVLNEAVYKKKQSGDFFMRRLLLAALCLTFGVELGFKLASKQMIWILNPCHLVTIMQIFLLAAPPCRLATAVFRIQMHILNGASIAILLPIVNTRLMPFETHVYYIQHALILIVPFYLLSVGGVYTAEKYSDFNWIILTLGLLFVYHWFPLQLLAIASKVNLNNMMCPAVSDPFHGVWYRTCAATHQTMLIFVHGKVYTYISSCMLQRPLTEDSMDDDRACVGCHREHIGDGVPQTNGRIKQE